MITLRRRDKLRIIKSWTYVFAEYKTYDGKNYCTINTAFDISAGRHTAIYDDQDAALNEAYNMVKGSIWDYFNIMDNVKMIRW